MKTEFTKDYILENRIYYTIEEMEKLPFINKESITLQDLFESLTTEHFLWFLTRKCGLTILEKRKFALHCAKEVLPIFESEHPDDNRVRLCIEATEKFINGEISNVELNIYREECGAAAFFVDPYANLCYHEASAFYDAAYAPVYFNSSAFYAAAASIKNNSLDSFKKSIWEYIKTIK